MITPVSEATNARKSVAFSDRIAKLWTVAFLIIPRCLRRAELG
jgi:hypothetical protein